MHCNKQDKINVRHHMYNVKSTYKRGCPQRWTNKITNCIPIPASKTKGYDLNLFLYSTQSQTLKKTKAYFPARFTLPVQLRVVEHHANPPPPLSQQNRSSELCFHALLFTWRTSPLALALRCRFLTVLNGL